jgi:oxygen-independent coproporphyrinogen-3 oxidase
MNADASFGLYVHIPFCVQKCAYCDFPTAPYRPSVVLDFLDALRREADSYAPRVTEPFTSVFFGGGTPSLLTSEQMTALMAHLRATFAVQPDAEITVEANPGTLDAAKLDAYRNAGINRLSFGAQAFDDHALSRLGREHTTDDTFQSYRNARNAGFDNVNLDLIFGLPGQRLSDWETTMRLALELAPEHVSTYGLTIEPKTVFAYRQRRGELVVPDDDAQATMFDAARDALASAGYRQYEISNYAKPGRESRHNVGYWINAPCLGLGPGAWGYLDGERYGNLRSVGGYVKRLREGASPVAERERLTPRAARAETVVQALRLLDGIPLKDYRQRFGSELDADYANQVAPLLAAGLLERTPTHLRLTRRGVLLANEVFARFVEVVA